MATSLDYIEYLCEQIPSKYSARYKKMFGEYMVYIDDKPILLVCDNTVYVKRLQQIADIMHDSDIGTPYVGAKEHYVLDIENSELLDALLGILVEITPLPKKRASKKE